MFTLEVFDSPGGHPIQEEDESSPLKTIKLVEIQSPSMVLREEMNICNESFVNM